MTYKRILRLFAVTGMMALGLLLLDCKTDANDKSENTNSEAKPESKTVEIPRFNRDSAYQFIADQVAFGPRVPNTPQHTACKDWIVSKLKSYGVEVIEQDFTAQSHLGERLKGTNIIGRINPTHKNRVLLCAHWDTRYAADADPDLSKREEAVLGADDAGSGVGVHLEIARLLQAHPIDLGVDIVFFDLEDQGKSSDENATEDTSDTWCLGSQYWGKNLHIKNYRAKYGILLDMVGSRNARFAKDGISMYYAEKIMNKVWKLAKNMGYGNYFVDARTPALVDDHKYVNELTGIPTIDIINRPDDRAFGEYWHTTFDDMSNIDKRTLRAVGQTVTAAIYQTSVGKF